MYEILFIWQSKQSCAFTAARYMLPLEAQLRVRDTVIRAGFYVTCTSYDGFDETEQTVFPDMLTEAAKIEDYIQANFLSFTL